MASSITKHHESSVSRKSSPTCIAVGPRAMRLSASRERYVHNRLQTCQQITGICLLYQQASSCLDEAAHENGTKTDNFLLSFVGYGSITPT
jgi:hypothetical protein